MSSHADHVTRIGDSIEFAREAVEHRLDREFWIPLESGIIGERGG